MVFCKPAFVFLVIVTIQTALSAKCPILCDVNYDPICAINNELGIKKIFYNRCELEATICLNGKPYDDVEWHLCFSDDIINENKQNSTGIENKTSTKNDNNINTTPSSSSDNINSNELINLGEHVLKPCGYNNDNDC